MVWNTHSVERLKAFPSVTLIQISLRKWGLSCQRKRESFTGTGAGRNTDIWTVKLCVFGRTSPTRSTSPPQICLWFNFSLLSFLQNLTEKTIFQIWFYSLSPAVGQDDVMMMSWWCHGDASNVSRWDKTTLFFTSIFWHITRVSAGFMKVNLRLFKTK